MSPRGTSHTNSDIQWENENFVSEFHPRTNLTAPLLSILGSKNKTTNSEFGNLQNFKVSYKFRILNAILNSLVLCNLMKVFTHLTSAYDFLTSNFQKKWFFKHRFYVLKYSKLLIFRVRLIWKTCQNGCTIQESRFSTFDLQKTRLKLTNKSHSVQFLIFSRLMDRTI
jgi:hypothetical protein